MMAPTGRQRSRADANVINIRNVNIALRFHINAMQSHRHRAEITRGFIVGAVNAHGVRTWQQIMLPMADFQPAHAALAG